MTRSLCGRLAGPTSIVHCFPDINPRSSSSHKMPPKVETDKSIFDRSLLSLDLSNLFEPISDEDGAYLMEVPTLVYQQSIWSRRFGLFRLKVDGFVPETQHVNLGIVREPGT